MKRYPLALSRLREGVMSLVAAIATSHSAPAQPIELLSLTNVWSYEQSGADLGTAWKEPVYDDSAWPAGPGVLADEDSSPLVQPWINTHLTRIGSNGQYIITDYFRTRFHLTTLQPGWCLIASNLVDDGAVLYLNGVELCRLNMPTGAVTAATFASQTIGDGKEGVFTVTNLPAAQLIPGDNLLAVEVHQPYVTSSDIVWGMTLLYQPQKPLLILSHPAHRTVPEGQPVALTVDVSGSLPRYQWFKDDTPIAGATGPVLHIPTALRSDAAQYFVVVTNDVSTVTSRLASVTVALDTQPPTLTSLGRSTFHSVRLYFSEPIDPVSATDPAHYRLASPAGTNVPIFYLNGQEFYRVGMPATPVTFNTQASRSATEGIFSSAVRVPATNLVVGHNLLAVEVHQYSLASPTLPDISFGLELSLDAESLVDAPPRLLSQPQDTTVPEGGSALFRAQVAGAEILQWLRDGTPVPGAASNWFTWTPARVDDSGAGFSLLLSNAFGMITSRLARLTVVPDLSGPRLLSASMGTNDQRILLTFSEALDPASAIATNRYSVTNQLGENLAVLAVTLTNGTNVILQTAHRSPGQRYALAVNGLRDRSAADNRVVGNGLAGVDYELLVFPYDGVWCYDDSGTNPAPAWLEPDYDDSFWRRGPGLLGFDEPGQVPVPLETQLEPPENRGPTYYFRTRFTFDGQPAGTVLRLRHVIDDGAVFHLNGCEIYRVRVPPGQNHTTITTQTVEAAVEGPFLISAAAFRPGPNVLAVEVHQNSYVSADVLFGAELVLAFPAPLAGPVGPNLQILRAGNTVALSWEFSELALESAPTPIGPWRLVPHPVLPYTVSSHDPAAFFRLHAGAP